VSARKAVNARRAAATPRRSPEQARAEILKAGAAFLSKRPFRDLTVERLMASTSIGRSAFYAYFVDRFDLAEALLLQVRGELLELTRPWFDDPADSVGALRKSLARVAEVWQRRGPMMRAIGDASAQDARLERLFRNVVAFMDRAVADAIRRDQAAGRIGALDADEVAIALNQLNVAYLNDRLGRRTRRDPAAVTRAIQRIWIRTLYEETSR